METEGELVQEPIVAIGAEFNAEGGWEDIAIEDGGIRVRGWAVRGPGGVPPARFALRWGGSSYDLVPNRERRDVEEIARAPAGLHGIEELARVKVDAHGDWSDAALTAEWPDGFSLALTPTHSAKDFFQLLEFKEFAEFEHLFQNPAFRKTSPIQQAFGAARALRIAPLGSNYWLAAAVVAIYRHIEHNAFARTEVETLLREWREIQASTRKSARGLDLRWATSMHLAAGYAYLAWGSLTEARDEFLAIAEYGDRIETWPQFLTNLGIGRIFAVFLTVYLGRRDQALEFMSGTEEMFCRGVAPLRIWNFHMYEELRGAVRVWQYNFVVKKFLEGEKQAHILPPNFRFGLSEVSTVMRSLVERGIVPKWRYPEDFQEK